MATEEGVEGAEVREVEEEEIEAEDTLGSYVMALPTIENNN